MRPLCLFFLHFLLVSFLVLLIFLLQPSTSTSAIKRPYVVYLGGHSHGPEVSEVDLARVQESHFDLLGSIIGREMAKEAIFYSYTRHINGFSAMLKDEDARSLAEHPEVVSLFLSKNKKVQTTRSWSFLGLEDGEGVIPTSSVWEKANFGRDIIIANLDTGVWPESKSFNDNGMGPIPRRWKGFCENDTTIHGVRCNRKLIGARHFNKGYLALLATLNASSRSPISNPFASTPRDADGHGTHTLSTAAGSVVPNASVFGYGVGPAKGGSPAARVAAYKVCWPWTEDSTCPDADILAAFDAAISDGVDVISVSLAGDLEPFFKSSIAIGSFHATMKGISVVCSAGNDGPADSTVSNSSPWEITVGASTIDRRFGNRVLLGYNKFVNGQSLAPKSLPPGMFYPILSAKDAKAANSSAKDALLCKPNSLDSKRSKGNILVCLRGVTGRIDKGEQVLLAGAVGMILANDVTSGNEVVADPHVLPASHISYIDGIEVFSYIKLTKSPMAHITQSTTQLGTKPAPFMAAFSSRGPYIFTPEILKPDITAPGVDIIAAYTEAQGPGDEKFDKRKVQFNSLSGTSMSCPHVAGIVGLLKNIHPEWSSAAIKSAIMTTASTIDNTGGPILNSSSSKADPFSCGSGHIKPNQAMDPGLVYDLTVNDYLNFLCSIGYNKTVITLFYGKPYPCPKNFSLINFNYPSISVPNLKGSVMVSRTVKNVGSSPATYKVEIEEPEGIKISMKPKVLKFRGTVQEKTFHMILKPKKSSVASKGHVFGRLTWLDGTHFVRSPIVVKTM